MGLGCWFGVGVLVRVPGLGSWSGFGVQVVGLVSGFMFWVRSSGSGFGFKFGFRFQGRVLSSRFCFWVHVPFSMSVFWVGVFVWLSCSCYGAVCTGS